ncbi:Uncharacterized membrane protein YsdA, DUF1294 family [Succiniclasticum ruminis]|uniref:Uncharacterized membrane protein YsdA, DUF1294 family n=1 Tax=Succiniclasticum ruminis TaxID=40841 RepID=A0A1G6LIH2_9FIRM|nr:DUF1294 domain-containing protein [Succiniclasticum ruminis]SDC43070.1 Uncharacterized membrane protein YsdA, DUF1294 family [Succiniclasticum ruminis]
MTFYTLIIVNIITFFVYGLDKLKAVNYWWRIPEWVLLGLAAAGGSVGAYLGMMVFRHKTLKPLFRFGVPVILLVHAGVAVYVWK